MASKTPSFDMLSSIMRPGLQEELRGAIQCAQEHGAHGMHDMLAYQLGWVGKNTSPQAQGKQIRPLLVLLTAQACGREWKAALPAAAAVELIHNFSLIHDDIEDNSSLRRGRPTVWKKWGQAQAINTGDAMLTLANLAMLRLMETTSPTITLPAMRIIHQTCLNLTQGQYLDMDFEIRSQVMVDEYWEMVEGKTASLIASCCELGALCAKTSEETRGFYQEFGHKLGLAFQAQDDLLGIWGETGKIGKSNTGDLLSGKKTLPIIYGLVQEKTFAARWGEGPLTAEEIPAMVQALEAEGAHAYTQNVTESLTTQAIEALHRANPQGKAGTALHELAHKLLRRKG